MYNFYVYYPRMITWDEVKREKVINDHGVDLSDIEVYSMMRTDFTWKILNTRPNQNRVSMLLVRQRNTVWFL